MNRNDRRQLSAIIRKYCCTVIPAGRELADSIESIKEREEDKLANLPDSLTDSRQAQNIDEAIDQMNEILEYLESIEEACDSIAETAYTEVTYPAAVYSEIPMKEDSPRNHRFQILLSEETMIFLKMRAVTLGFSCNELINQAIQNELFKDPSSTR